MRPLVYCLFGVEERGRDERMRHQGRLNKGNVMMKEKHLLTKKPSRESFSEETERGVG